MVFGCFFIIYRAILRSSRCRPKPKGYVPYHVEGRCWLEYQDVLHFEVPLTTALMCRKAKAIELMVVDAMLEADVELRISERIHDPDLFVTLDDTLLRQIEVYGLLPGLVRPVPEKIVSMGLNLHSTFGLPEV